MDQSWLTERFEEHRARLRGVAYRVLGSVSEAEDAVQEAWLRLNRIDAAAVDNLGGWLTTVVSRVCLDMLRSRKSRREEPSGAQVTEPSVKRGEGADPEGEAVLGGGLGLVGARYAAGLLYGVGPGDPAAFVAAGGTLLGVTLVAALIPAVRATRVDPMMALRIE